MGIDFLAIGDAVVDDFIRLKDAEVHCDANKEHCSLSMRFPDKIPFESSTIVYGVGNAGNAAIAATRLGLTTALVTNIGKDRNGDEIIRYYKKEGLGTKFVRQHRGAPTNYHYVLWYGDDRTILINHHPYPYEFPKSLPAPKTVYLSSLAGGTETYHDALADWLAKNSSVFFAFQPGTFQMNLGKEKLARLYERTDIFFANKEEYQRTLGTPNGRDEKELMREMCALGPKIVILTDGVRGVSALDHDGTFLHLDMFPDPKPPLERTGAGDAFASTTAAYLTMGMNLKDAMLRGTVNSAYVVQDIGAQRGLLTKKVLESKLN